MIKQRIISLHNLISNVRINRSMMPGLMKSFGVIVVLILLFMFSEWFFTFILVNETRTARETLIVGLEKLFQLLISRLDY